MSAPTLCVVHNNIDDTSSIGKVAKWAVEQALEAGYRVTAVARDLDPVLAERVEHLRLHVPRRLHLYQWLMARRTVVDAIGDRRFDVVHVHQPQLGSLGDVLQCHFLMRGAWRHGALARPVGFRGTATYLQQQAVVRAEDRYVRSWPRTTKVLYDSDFLRREHDAIYGSHPNAEVLLYPAPEPRELTESDRSAARLRWAPEATDDAIVVGFLGGSDPRKGAGALIKAAEGRPDVFVLGGGDSTGGWHFPTLGHRQRWVGRVQDVPSFLSACDVLAVPSRFEPFGLVVFEAAALGVPSVATASVGALETVRRFGAGFSWDSGLGEVVHELRGRRDLFRAAAFRMAQAHAPSIQGAKLVAVYDGVMRRAS